MIPDCLRRFADTPAWVCWTSGKVPVGPHTGREAETDNPATWGVLAAAQKRLAYTPALRGVGIVSAGVPDLVFIDLDDCLDPATGHVTQAAGRLLTECSGTYSEITPSGAGLRIIGIAPEAPASFGRKGVLPGGLKAEAYRATARYLTVTGNRFGYHPDAIADISETICTLLPMFGDSGTPDGSGHDGREDAELIRLVVTGKQFHPALCPLAARYIGRGIPAMTVLEILRGLMLSHPEITRDARWQDRFSKIDALVASAVKKYQDDAHNRRENDRRLRDHALKLCRLQRPSGEIYDAVSNLADALGLSEARALSAAEWAFRTNCARRAGHA
jgi:hypothetical protein